MIIMIPAYERTAEGMAGERERDEGRMGGGGREEA